MTEDNQRNVEGLRQSAQKKRQEAIERTEAAIVQLLKSHQPINFNSVAEVAGVSKTWLYNQHDFRTRIENLRSQQDPSRFKPSREELLAETERLAEELRRVKLRIDSLNDERRDLLDQNKRLRAKNQNLKLKLSGLKDLIKENEQLQKEKQRLFNRLISSESDKREKQAIEFDKAKEESAGHFPIALDVEF